MECSRRLYKGNSYDICFPLTDTGITLARFYTLGDIIIEKEPEISGDSMCFYFSEEDLAVLPDGVLRYEIVTEYETIDTNSPYVVVTPGDYSGQTIDDLLAEAYESGFTEGYESGYTDGGESAYESGYTAGYENGYVSGYTDGTSSCEIDYSKEYFTVRTRELQTEWPEPCRFPAIAVYQPGVSYRYAYPNGEFSEWYAIASSATQQAPWYIKLPWYTSVQFKALGITSSFNATGLFSGPDNAYTKFEVYGNIASLQYGDDFIGETEAAIPFSKMFSGCTGLLSAENLVLPGTILGIGAYQHMFYGCTGLVSAPSILPATTLNTNCYSGMFNGCSSLTTAPELPATTLATSCYASMFWGCSSLTTAPELPATTLARNCYYSMFARCTNLTYIKCLATNISAQSCTNNWLYYASDTGTFETPSTTNWTTGVNGIPEGWTRVNSD